MKGVELGINTLVIIIIALVVLIFVIFFIYNGTIPLFGPQKNIENVSTNQLNNTYSNISSMI